MLVVRKQAKELELGDIVLYDNGTVLICDMLWRYTYSGGPVKFADSRYPWTIGVSSRNSYLTVIQIGRQ